MGSVVEIKVRNIILRAIASPQFVFSFDNIDSYWASLTTSAKPWVRDALEHVGDGRIAPCVFSLLANRWVGEPVKMLKLVCKMLVSNLVFSAILMSVGACRGRIRTSSEAKVVADNMEAYVAAYARQFGTRRLKSWVFRAFAPLVDSIRSPCTIAWLTQIPVCSAKEIETAVATLVLNNPTNTQDMPCKPAKRKCLDDTEPLPKKAKLREGSRVVLGDRTNGQARSKRTRPKLRTRTQLTSDSPPSLLQRMSDAYPPPVSMPMLDPYLLPYLTEAPPTLLQRMTSLSPSPQRSHAQYQHQQYDAPYGPANGPWDPFRHPHPAVSAFSSSVHMPWWTACGIFASAMEDIGVSVPK
ncbi:hypothetical protein DFH07DRAFT_327127 [Mycena maculata]|uniref:Uncharacterized protein n=1 Tax=Mycena maculata TaxID=230809 RepID=A0AAD7JLG5_9AGAR|nr:hypothetical protein DFH07DRAFT_327127 [Mycena maculata]